MTPRRWQMSGLDRWAGGLVAWTGGQEDGRTGWVAGRWVKWKVGDGGSGIFNPLAAGWPINRSKILSNWHFWSINRPASFNYSVTVGQ